jgi:hypothetical protein
MINPTQNRLDYGEILSPPLNYELDFAIGTTYSLDLKALVGALISLNLSEEMGSNLTNNSIFLLRVLRESTDKVALFCESGQIHLSNKPNKLYVLLEDTVFEVKTNNEFQKNKFASFHPKFWLLRFINPENGDFLYRLIVLSRNLTFDNSWDITFAMDGKQIVESTKDKNEPIISFIKYLTEFSTKDKTKIMEEIINDLNHVHFDLDSKEFNYFKFILNGVDNQKYSIQKESLFTQSLNELLIMSPFLSNQTIQSFNSRKNLNSKATLITQQASLKSLNKSDCSNFDVYILRDEIINGESQINDDLDVNDDSKSLPSQNIHAKIYIVENNKQIDLYLGSLNASQNALYNNVEFMIKLTGNNKKLPMENLINDIFNGDFGGPNDPFKLVADVDDYKDDGDSQSNLNLVVKYLTRLDPKAEIISNGENKYDVKLTFKEPDWEFLNDKEIKISPLFTRDKTNFSTLMTFKNLEKVNLSVFYEVIVNYDSNEFISVIKVKTKGMPEDRDKKVISSIFENKTDFYTYVSFMFDDNYVLTASEWDNFKKRGSKSFYTQLSGLYEKMLKTACINKDKFNDLDSLIQDISKDDVVPEDFKKLYDTFMEVIEDGFE